jgi:hypothetical protein
MKAESGNGKEAPIYRFSTFQELTDRVPSDRIRDCMEEIGTVIAAAKATVELHYSVARQLAKIEGKELPSPEEGEQVIELPPEFEWIDDGKRELEAQLSIGGEAPPYMSVKAA